MLGQVQTASSERYLEALVAREHLVGVPSMGTGSLPPPLQLPLQGTLWGPTHTMSQLSTDDCPQGSIIEIW